MSRNEGKIGTGDEAVVDSAPIWAEIAAQARLTPISRPVAVARYLAAGEGWREASIALRGAFAQPGGNEDG